MAAGVVQWIGEAVAGSHGEADMSDPWALICWGPWTEVLCVQSKMEAHGIPAIIQDEVVKIMFPFYTGSCPLELRLLVPESAKEEAEELLAARVDEEVERDPGPERIRSFARRTRWTAVFPISAPYGLYLAWRYFRAIAQHGLRPRYHASVVAACWLDAAWLLCIALMWPWGF